MIKDDEKYFAYNKVERKMFKIQSPSKEDDAEYLV